MDYAAMAEDLRAAMQARGYSRYALIGHSMGGKAAMTAALTDPSAVERLVVVDHRASRLSRALPVLHPRDAGA